METTNGYRHDLTGLRAVAVLLVVLFHAGVPGFDAGFVGVDVFFVLSGFLITRGLMDQLESTGRIDLVAFWAARVRRLLPAAATVIAGTVLASFVVLSPFLWRSRLTEAWASTFYFANVHFGNDKQSYFGGEGIESPLLHFWSLSIEEQWYVVLPLAMTLTALVFRGDRKGGVLRLLMVAVGCSFAMSIAATQVPRTATTYFSSFSRVWELGAGGLLSLAGLPSVLQRIAPVARRVAGFLFIGLSLVVVDPAAVYPGGVALLPVVGTLLVIDALGGPVGPLESKGARWLGAHSYSWYLWHWPVIVLGEAALLRWAGIEASVPVAASLAAASLLPTMACRRWIEEPFRTSERLRSSASFTFASVGGVVALSALVLVGSGEVADNRFDQPAMLAFSEASNDEAPLPDVCATADPTILLASCASGELDSNGKRVFLLGDSHMANWVPAFEAAVASRPGDQVVWALGGSCPLIGDGVTFDRWWCSSMRNEMPEAIDELDPDIVVIGHRTNGYLGSFLDADGVTISPDDQLHRWVNYLTDFANEMRSKGRKVVLVQPTPTLAEHPLHCASLASDPDECVGTRAELEASIALVADAQRSALQDIPSVTIFEPIDVVCTNERCPFEDDGHVVWTDTHHVTSTYAKTKANEVANYLE